MRSLIFPLSESDGSRTYFANLCDQLGMMAEHPDNDWTSGIVTTDSGELLARPKRQLREFAATILGQSATVQEQHGKFVRLVVNPVMVCGNECAVSLLFANGELAAALIVLTENTAERLGVPTGFSSPPDGPEARWLASWVLNETKRRPPATFQWGSIGAINDSKSGFNRIGFYYR